jgi:methane/ammonia monooxygenase subunit C
MLYLVFYSFIRWYEGVYGWSAGLDSFAPEFETYWMNMLYIELVVEVTLASTIWGYLWKSRDRKVMSITPREDLRSGLSCLAAVLLKRQLSLNQL